MIKSVFSVCITFLLIISKVFAGSIFDLPTDRLLELASEYEHGENRETDYEQAIIHYCHAARRDNAIAFYHLGWIYFNGRGVAINDILAAQWFLLAAEKGDKLAAGILEHLPDVEKNNQPDCVLVDGTVYLEPLRTEKKPNQKKITYWVERLSRQYELDPALVLAVIETESNFQVQAKSEKNAMGLMQLIPETARRFKVDDVWDPLQNIHGGMAYLKWLHEHFDDKLEFVLAAYNAGENVVKRYGGIPPYRETQNYVKKVNRLYQRNLSLD